MSQWFFDRVFKQAFLVWKDDPIYGIVTMTMDEFLDELHLSCPKTRDRVAAIFNNIVPDFNTDLMDIDRKVPGFYSHFLHANYSDVKIVKGNTVAFS